MKKFLSLLSLCLALSQVLCCCGGEVADTDKGNEASSGTSSSENITSTVVSEEESKSELLTGTLKMPTVDVYVDTPGYNCIEEGYTRIFFHSGKKYITFTCLYIDTASSLSECHDKMIPTFMNSVSDHHLVNELGETTDKTLEVNGIETYNFEGVLNAGEIPVYDAYIYGYSFIFQGYPCSIIGVVTDESQPEEEKELVKDIVDEMMTTVRDTP
ncbi:MAG: hypothetical protein IJB65_06870 [Clostridia bacterium]|nr:hypothetical protein [Clostridia bacterium]